MFGPPSGTFDREWVAHDVQRVVAGLDFARAYAVVGLAWQALRHGVPADSEALSRRLERDGVDEALARATADRVLTFCEAYAVTV